MLSIEGARRVSDNALLVFGGIGYTREYPIERLYRNARPNWLEEATPTIHYLVAARRLLDGQRTYERFQEEVVENPVERQIKGILVAYTSRLYDTVVTGRYTTNR